jgi:hypothetical protein
MGAGYRMQTMSAKKMERFLEDFANLRPGGDAEADAERFLRLYGSVFPESFPQQFEDNEREQDRLLRIASLSDPRTDAEIHEATHMALWGLASQLRRVWDESDLEAKEWYVDELRRWFYLRTEPSRSRQVPSPPPSRSTFQEILRHLKNNADRARHCMRPGCLTPYYFSLDRRATRYCSGPCTDWAKKDAKLRYDRKHRKGTRGHK